MSEGGYKYLDLVKKVDVIPYLDEQVAYKNYESTTFDLITHDGTTCIGKVIPYVVQIFLNHVDITRKSFVIDVEAKTVKLNPNLTTFEQRSSMLQQVAIDLANLDCLETLKGWRNEKYVCYYPQKTAYFAVERSFSPALGIVMYGVHINGYIPPELSLDGQMKLWIAQRSLSKPTWPGMLDNTIAGGIAYPYSVQETVVKESMEEANVSEAYLKENLTSVGVITYIFSPQFPQLGKNSFEYSTEGHNENYFIQPECEFIYDLTFSELDSTGKTLISGPQINDNEVMNFKLMTVPQVAKCLQSGEFKPNCAAVIIDFFIRKGIITPENEPDYLDIVQHLHRKFPYPTM